MGHCCSVEIMQTLGAAVAGHPDYVLPQFFHSPEVHCDVWVDNIRYTGPVHSVQQASARLDSLAAGFHITWKEADSFTAATRYDFLGISFDHINQTVRPTNKLIKKLTNVDFTTAVAAGDVESLVGRLVHASAISKVFLGSFYTPLKWSRRIINSLNRGIRTPSTAVDVPTYVRSELRRWIHLVQQPVRIKREPLDLAYTIFVDASLDGWGGVIVERATNKITVLGARWAPRFLGLHINVLEALALRNVAVEIPQEASGGRLQIFVDNTTVRSVAHKGVCVKNRELNDAVVEALTHLRNMQCACSIQWIKSADNPADPPSRIPMSSLVGDALARVTDGVKAFLTKRPGG